MPEKILVQFIKKARNRGFSDYVIRREMLRKNWPESKITDAFESLMPKFKSKNQVCLYLNDKILKILEKRAGKNMLTLSEQIEDILRRSSIRKTAGTTIPEKLDDSLLACFSRKKK